MLTTKNIRIDQSLVKLNNWDPDPADSHLRMDEVFSLHKEKLDLYDAYQKQSRLENKDRLRWLPAQVNANDFTMKAQLRNALHQHLSPPAVQG